MALHLVTKFCFTDQKKQAAITLSEVCKADLNKPPQLVTFDSYDSVELNKEFGHLGIDKIAPKTSYEGPPPKRRKVQETTETYDQVVVDFYSILGAQTATDLDGLSQIAE